MISGLIPYDERTMGYTHYDNIQGMCMTRDQYFATFAGGADFPIEAPMLAKLAAKMIKTDFVKHREFDSCFEMGNGSAVMALLVNMALEDDELRDWWTRGAYFIGSFAKAKQRVYPKDCGQSACSV